MYLITPIQCHVLLILFYMKTIGGSLFACSLAFSGMNHKTNYKQLRPSFPARFIHHSRNYGETGTSEKFRDRFNLVPRVLRLLGQRLVARRDCGVLEFYYRRISAVKPCKPLRSSQSKNLNFFEFSRVSPGTHPLTKNREDSVYEIGIVWVDGWKLCR